MDLNNKSNIEETSTPFSSIYDFFFSIITEDMYMEITIEETARDCKSLLLSSLIEFEFPRFSLYDFDEDEEKYNVVVTKEEQRILAQLMKITWLTRQLDSVEVTRMKYSGSDFKMTSQANHMDKLKGLLTKAEEKSLHLQRLYKRRDISKETGRVTSTWAEFGKLSALDD